jgi:hypothetical protein
MFPIDATYCVSSIASGNRNAAIQKNGVSFRIATRLQESSPRRRHRPRVILVENHGELVGLVTVKDVLRFTAIHKAASEPSWMECSGIDEVLEESLKWLSGTLVQILNWSRSLVR